MPSQQAIDNLNYATDLAKAGQEAPLVGGPIGFMWGLLLTATLGTHWGIITGKLPFEIWHLGFLWVFFSIIGGVASAILSRTLKQKPSFHSTANQIEQSVWLMFSIMLGCFWVGITLSILFGSGTPALFDFVVIAGFGGQGLAYGVTARMSHHKWLAYPSGASFLASIVCIAAFGQPLLYLIAAVATVFTVVLPSIKTIESELVEQ